MPGPRPRQKTTDRRHCRLNGIGMQWKFARGENLLTRVAKPDNGLKRQSCKPEDRHAFIKVLFSTVVRLAFRR